MLNVPAELGATNFKHIDIVFVLKTHWYDVDIRLSVLRIDRLLLASSITIPFARYENAKTPLLASLIMHVRSRYENILDALSLAGLIPALVSTPVSGGTSLIKDVLQDKYEDLHGSLLVCKMSTLQHKVRGF